MLNFLSSALSSPTIFFFLSLPLSPSFFLAYKNMGILLEGKACGENIQGMDGLEEKVSELFGEDGNDSNNTLEDQHDGYEFDGNDSHNDPVERNLYWETQEVLLQVHIIN